MNVTEKAKCIIDEYFLHYRSYEATQDMLALLNEKDVRRKTQGVYYTPRDVMRFIVDNCFKAACGILRPSNICSSAIEGLSYLDNYLNKTIFDPTCGTGGFLLMVLCDKADILDANRDNPSVKDIRGIVDTIHGNDINADSIAITKMRITLCVSHRYGKAYGNAVSDILDRNFTCYDFITDLVHFDKKYDMIVGNPPYVEDRNSNTNIREHYGNIYANVLVNSSALLKDNGAMGFVIPLSYISTPRMNVLRQKLLAVVQEQYIINYCDRPDCLFSAVHQKLCILIGKKTAPIQAVYTSNYQYWYKEERGRLFVSTAVTKNLFVGSAFIPKLGNGTDSNVYKKVTDKSGGKVSLYTLMNSGIKRNGGNDVYLCMRGSFWVKAFTLAHEGKEYKRFCLRDSAVSNFVFCLLNSSLFWWYWICVSDCWHITNKELSSFIVPPCSLFNEYVASAIALEDKLEKTKVYVGTNQVDYEYKHKACLDEIHAIDDKVNELFALTKDEGEYIKNFALRYRVGGGAL